MTCRLLGEAAIGPEWNPDRCSETGTFVPNADGEKWMEVRAKREAEKKAEAQRYAAQATRQAVVGETKVVPPGSARKTESGRVIINTTGMSPAQIEAIKKQRKKERREARKARKSRR